MGDGQDMTDTSEDPALQQDPALQAPARRGVLQMLEIDTRLLGMILAFLIICVGFQLWTSIRSGIAAPLDLITSGNFLTPRNIFNITIQTVSVAIMATGMVFVIVLRHIDLSVGAILAVCSAVMGVLQTRWLPEMVPFGSPLIAPLAILAGLAVGTLIGSFNGWLIGVQGIPSFIVTLGGLLVWRNVGWYITSGQTLGPLDPTFSMFGGTEGTLGPGLSWGVAILASVAAVVALVSARRTRTRHEFPVKPLWAEMALGTAFVLVIVGFIGLLNSYMIPTAKLERMFEARDKVMPVGFTQGYGIPISVMILILVAVVMTVIARRTRLGRYIFATGGNPDAAELSGINTRLLTVKVFAIMGFLCGLSAVVASARQTFHSNDIGTLDELRTIAAAVIGGTALSGGIGTIYGAILGALIMQSLQSGMGMVGVDSPLQNIVVGLVLVFAVWVDIQYRKRWGGR